MNNTKKIAAAIAIAAVISIGGAIGDALTAWTNERINAVENSTATIQQIINGEE